MSLNTVTVSEINAALPPRQTTEANEIAVPAVMTSTTGIRRNILERRQRRQERRLARA